jgi:putative transposase
VFSSDTEEKHVIGMDTQNDRVELYYPKTKVTEHCSIRELRRELADEKFRSSSPKTAFGSIYDLVHREPAMKKFQFKLAVAKTIKKIASATVSVGSAIGGLLGKNITLASGEERLMCSAREAYRIFSLYALGEKHLIPLYTNRGNKKSRYPDRIAQIALEFIEEYFLVKKSKIDMLMLTKMVNLSATSEELLGEGVKVKVSRKYITHLIIFHFGPDIDKYRLDPRITKSRDAVATQRIRPGGALQRVEIDAVHLPILALDGDTVAENIWVLIAIDCETSMPLSWWFMLTYPTSEDTFSCLERALYPKDELLMRMGVSFAVDPYGTMTNLFMDNGSENTKTRLAKVTTVGVNTHWVEVNSGHKKPFVERFNRSFKIGLQCLPGSTRSAGKDGDRTPEARKDKLMTVGALEKWVVSWLYEKWPHTLIDKFVTADYEIERNLGITPAERWGNYELTHVLPRSPDREDWRRCRYLEAKKALNKKTGISLEGFDFKGPELKTLIKQYGDTTEVPVFYNPHDYRTIYAPDKKTGHWLLLINAEVSPETPAYPFIEATRRRRAVKSTYVEHEHARQFDKKMFEKILEEKPKTKKRAERLADAHKATRERDAKNRAC